MLERNTITYPELRILFNVERHIYLTIQVNEFFEIEDQKIKGKQKMIMNKHKYYQTFFSPCTEGYMLPCIILCFNTDQNVKRFIIILDS